MDRMESVRGRVVRELRGERWLDRGEFQIVKDLIGSYKELISTFILNEMGSHWGVLRRGIT